ncbi:hypothetical protein OROMI_004515 [Orobanche minor]
MMIYISGGCYNPIREKRCDWGVVGSCVHIIPHGKLDPKGVENVCYEQTQDGNQVDWDKN